MGYMENKQRSKYARSFFCGIIFFVIIDIGVYMDWIVPRSQLLVWLGLAFMILGAFSMFIAGNAIQLSKKLSAFTAGMALISFIVVLIIKGFI